MLINPRRLLLIISLTLLLNACIGLEPKLAEPLPTSTPTPTATATKVWFPPTVTPTTVTTRAIVPTPEKRPGIGEIVLSDTFSEQTEWQTARNNLGSVAFGRNELTIAIAGQRGIINSLRETPILDDFYLEITASPSLCRDIDTYGILLRAGSNIDYYRYVIGCNGQIRLERLKNGKIAVLQNWIPSGQVPPGSPLVLRLGVWAMDDELRFFINDIYQFNIHDPVWRSGQIGLFARSGSDSPLTVSFSDLKVNYLSEMSQEPLIPTAPIIPTTPETRGD